MIKKFIVFLVIFTLFFGCSKEPKVLLKQIPNTKLKKTRFSQLPNWKNENYQEALKSFLNSCKSEKTQNLYADLCRQIDINNNQKEFFENNFDVYQIVSNKKDSLLTGYYEAKIRASLTKKPPYIYPVYSTPNDLISVELESIYPDLKNYRLRGRLENKKIVPYFTREQMQSRKLDAKVICYTDSKIDLFFLEVQGSGRAILEDGKNLFLGYNNQNGHKYSSIGKYFVDNGKISSENISLSSIKNYLKNNPTKVDEVLNHNKSVVYFKQTNHSASGSLGTILTPKRSVAVDTNFIPLGSMLFLNAKIDKKEVNRIVLAEDTGGAIKGALRADMFFGYDNGAMDLAGELKSPLKLWILLPKDNL